MTKKRERERERVQLSTPIRRLGFELTDAVPLMRITIISIVEQYRLYLSIIIPMIVPIAHTFLESQN